ncbi:MAG: hypothetical protein KDE31_33845, partial [Caldilineaceae bacterium]|nr:hypothetical protein [Caldilineaceae bacterium]
IITVTNVDENSAPTAAAGGPYVVDEGSSVTLDGSGSTDAEQDPAILSYTWAFDNDGIYDDDTGINPTFDAIDGPATVTVGLLVTDEGGLTSTERAAITINNVPPTIANVSATQAPVAVGAAINAGGSFSDPGVNDTHTGTWDWGDGSTSAATINGGTVGSDNHTYAAPGVYTLKLTITDNDGDSAEQSYQFVVVYDPSVGFVTGGGAIDSPAGAYVADPSLTGEANFGFVAKYKKGQSTPDGNTQFQFKIADLQFHSNAYEWLVVTSGGKAMFKGTGTINGAGNYGFLISAIDADIASSTDVDLFRIKIWDRDNRDVVVYDNQLDAGDDADPTTAITGGNIKIHQQGGGNKANSADADTTNGENNQIFLPLIANSD